MRHREQGAITVYLSIILLAVIVLAGGLVDGARIRAADTQVKRAVDTAMKSVLAEYHHTLKEEYGLFALHQNDRDYLDEALRFYLNRNLMTELETGRISWGSRVYNKGKQYLAGEDRFENISFLNLYDYRIEDVKVTPIFNLSENEVTKQQILEYMKYRAPKELIDGFIEKLHTVKQIGKTSDACKERMKLEGEYAKLEDKQRDLYEQIQEVNGLDLHNEHFSQYFESARDYMNQLEDIERLQEKADKETDADRKKELKSKLSRAKRRRNKLKEDKNDNCDKLNTYLTRLNRKATELIPGVDKEKSDVQKETLRQESYIAVSTGIISQYQQNYEERIGKIKTAINRDNAQQLKPSLQHNHRVLLKMAGDIKAFNAKIDEETDVSGFKSQLKTTLRRTYRNQIDYHYDYIKPAGKSKDPREAAAKKGERALQQEKGGKKITKALREQLPSYFKNGTYPNKVISADFDQEDKQYSDNAKGDNAGYVKEGDVNFEKRDFSDKAFEDIAKVGTFLEDNMIDLRDNVYINEYIMGTFKNKVPVLTDDKGNRINFPYNLRVRDKKQRDAFFEDCEVEYILHGKDSEAENLALVKGQILLIRFVADTIAAYTEPDKVKSASAVAASVSWVTGGIAYGLVHTFVMCSYGMIEAVKNLSDIMKGKPVPIITIKDQEMPAFSYHDYLRLFLLLESEQKKMNRIADLIQLNTGLKAGEYNTVIRTEVTVSVKYFFMTQPFVPAQYKVPEGDRHQITVVSYEGY